MSKLRRVTILRVAGAGAIGLALALARAPGAAAATGRAGHSVRGLDISAYQHTGKAINWRLLGSEGIRFVAIKASEGTYYTNPYYLSDARGAAAAGLAVLPYVFANPSRAHGAQTARFAVSAAHLGRGASQRLPLVVDLENDPYKQDADCYGLGVHRMIRWISGFLLTAHARTGKWPVIYTTAAWWRECTGSTARFAADPLWLAAFGGTQPAAPFPWSRWAFWQYDDQAVLPGIGQTDLDYYQPTSNLPALRPLTHAKNARKAGKARKTAKRRSL
jgi:GH25 family lysozyme M1 (1,4-beta-N-acetylmuramidase)